MRGVDREADRWYSFLVVPGTYHVNLLGEYYG